MFKIWSEKNNEAKKMLSPNLDLRDWNQLSSEEKEKIWNFLKIWFLKKDKNHLGLLCSVILLNEEHKFRSYAKLTLQKRSKENAICDFQSIFLNQDQHVVLELISFFCEFIQKRQGWGFEKFDKFAEYLNDVFEHFSVNLLLTRDGFIERQDCKITNKIYTPVVNFLSTPKWKEVNRELSDAFKEYQAKTEQGYSHCITHAISSIQAFLQILIYGKIGRSDGISRLIEQARDKKLIPIDKFSQEIFKNIDAILMRERGKTGDAHPKQEYANEKSARLVLNLVMVFLQHCIQN